MSHPQHPNCSACGKALFKSPAAVKVKPADPYAFCRNAACADYTFRNDRPADPKKPTPEQLAKAVRISGEAFRLVPARAKFLVRPALKGKRLRVDDPASVRKKHKKEKCYCYSGKDRLAIGEAHKPHCPQYKPATPAPVPASPPEPAKPPATKPVSKRGVPRRAVPLADAPAKPKESEEIAKARDRIRQFIAAVTPGSSKEAIGIVLAIVSQETGHKAAANALIDEFDLEKTYGFQKFDDLRAPGPKE